MSAQDRAQVQIVDTAEPTPAQADAIRAAVEQTGADDRVAPVGDGPLRYLAGGDGARHLLVLGPGEELVGYGNVQQPGTESASAELFVRPAARGAGIGARLLTAVLEVGGDHTRVWAHGDLPAARALAARAALPAQRELLQLRRGPEAGDLPAVAAAESVTVRTFTPADEAELLRVNAAAFSWHPEQGQMDAADFAAQRGEAWFDPAGLFLAVEQDDPTRVLGFHWTKVHPATDEEPARGEVYVVGVDPAAQGRKLGALLTLVGLHHLHDQGLDTVLLYVEGDNVPALKTYERLGFTRFRTDVAYGRH